MKIAHNAHRSYQRLFFLPFLLIFFACTKAPTAPSTANATGRYDHIAPEAATGWSDRTSATGKSYLVSSANTDATRAGLGVLRHGGNAMDAAVAIQMVLGLSEPQSSGIGGGGFLLHYDAQTGQVRAFDGRETAPASASPDMFLDDTGKPRAFMEAVVGGLSVGVPGIVRMLELAHRSLGSASWKSLFEPAIALAEQGFRVSPRTTRLIALDESLRGQKNTAAYFYDPAGQPLAAGSLHKNAAYARTLDKIANAGADAFYSGELADAMVTAVTQTSKNPGRLSSADLNSYQAVERDAVCRPYRAYLICGMSPPSSGGITLLQIMGILEHFDLRQLGTDSIDAIHLQLEAMRLGYADRDLYIADPAFFDVPVEALLEPTYLNTRSSLIRIDQSMGIAAPGNVVQGAHHFAPDRMSELPATSHFVVMDREGDVVSMTTSIEYAFGSRLMVDGYLLNNQLTDFSFLPQVNGQWINNRIEPGKRPRSSMSPVIVLHRESRQFYLAIGSPGGSRIIPYVVQALVSILDGNMGLKEAIDRPHFVNRNGKTELEKAPGWEQWATELGTSLKARGHDVEVVELNSGLHSLMVTPEGMVGAADPRRDGAAIGE